MCGVLGAIWRTEVDLAPEIMMDALGALAHRGPDAQGIHRESNVFLGHRRLSIIDLDPRSNQPMHRGSLTIVFNGEIYNYRALRSYLEDMGVAFATKSDTEVLLALFEREGLDCLSRLEGMFSFSIWDRDRRRLTMARDRYGEKPLLYYFDHNALLFASEMPALELLAGDQLQVDRRALPWLLRFSYFPAPTTPYVGLRQLRPAHWVQLDLDQWSIEEGCYYKLSAPRIFKQNENISFDDAKVELRRLLKASVMQRLAAADVPIATFLSGGLDSSIISSIAAQCTESKISAYSVGFPEDPAFDESSFARALAAHHPKIEHHVIDITEDKLAGFADHTLDLLGEPYADASLIPTAYLCSHVHEKVILGGDGADELFGGYGAYSAMLMSARIPSWIKSLVNCLPNHGNPAMVENSTLRAIAFLKTHIRPTSASEYLSWRSYATPSQIEELGFSSSEANALPDEFAALRLSTLREILIMDMRFNLSADMLKKVDLASMQHSLEVRLPFLDSELVMFALSLPESFMISGGTRKHVLREAFRDQLPQEILGRGKKGFLLPIRKWMKSGRIREELLDLAREQSFLNSKAIERFAGDHQTGRVDHSQLLWACYVLLKWKRRRPHCAE